MTLEFADGLPDDEEAAAIISVAVREILSRRKSIKNQVAQDELAWRFSGRWWNQPVAVGRKRPTLL
ncbi:MAG: hypothetical protein M0Z96_04165 [Actinomycetota bacterium]|nr:hypothetical protein [Actinomycetota bacterium]